MNFYSTNAYFGSMFFNSIVKRNNQPLLDTEGTLSNVGSVKRMTQFVDKNIAERKLLKSNKLQPFIVIDSLSTITNQ